MLIWGMGNLKSRLKISDGAGIKIAISLVIVLVASSSIFIYKKLKDFEQNKALTADIIEFREQLDMIFESVQKSDLGMRGFYINPNEMMLNPHQEAIVDQKVSLDILTKLFNKYGLELNGLQEFMGHVKEYINLNETLIGKIHEGDLEYVASVVADDPGYELWLKYSAFMPAIEEYLDQIISDSEKEYQRDIFKTIFMQLIILIFGIPALLIIMKKINSTAKRRAELFEIIDDSNRKYVFDDHSPINIKDEERIINYLKNNLEEASSFIKGITNGNYKISWNGLTDSLVEFNKDNLTGDLMHMRDQMIDVKTKADQNLWSVNGLAKFAEIIRSNTNDINNYADMIVSSLVKYVEANQGAFFVVDDEEETLELKGCYAYDRIKFMGKTILRGQGLAGQCWQGKNIMLLKEIPEDYVSITSGLGEANPTNLIIAPVLAEEKVLGIIELGSFIEFSPHKIEFVEKLCTSIGSSLATLRVNEKTSQLLQESEEMSERLRSQEEELLQNSEELQATQEEMQRKLSEAEKKIRAVEALVGQIELNEKGSLVNAERLSNTRDA